MDTTSDSENTPRFFKDEVLDKLSQYSTRPLDAFQEARNLLQESVKPDGRFDPLLSDNEWKEGRDGYHNAHNWFKEHRYFAASEKLLFDWWDDLGVLQVDTPNKHIYRAETAFLLTDLYWTMGDQGMAFRWALHMQADDILHQHPEGGGAGRQILPTQFGIEDSAFLALNNLARKNLEQAQQSNDWTQPTGFAEDIFTNFARGDTGYVIARVSTLREMRLSKGYLQSLQRNMTDLDQYNEQKYNYQKGKLLEDIAFYLCLLLPGCVPHSNVLKEKQVYETDIVVHNLSPNSTAVSDLLGRQFIVECKNKQHNIGVSELGYFLYRMKLTHTRFGILFTRKGITGDESGKAADQLRQQAYHLDDLICIVINNEDLEELASGEQQYFWWMLLDKIEKVRFGQPAKNY